MSNPDCLRAFADVCRYFEIEMRDYAKLVSLVDAPEGQRGSELFTALLFLTELEEADINRFIELTPAWQPFGETASIREAVEDIANIYARDVNSAAAEAACRVIKTSTSRPPFAALINSVHCSTFVMSCSDSSRRIQKVANRRS